MSIDDFIEIVKDKLKDDVAIGEEEWSGEDLNLTGLKNPEGGKWHPRKLYTIKVPVWIHVEPEEHKRLIRKAFLRENKVGVKKYLTKFLKEDDLNKVMSVL